MVEIKEAIKRRKAVEEEGPNDSKHKKARPESINRAVAQNEVTIMGSEVKTTPSSSNKKSAAEKVAIMEPRQEDLKVDRKRGFVVKPDGVE